MNLVKKASIDVMLTLFSGFILTEVVIGVKILNGFRFDSANFATDIGMVGTTNIIRSRLEPSGDVWSHSES